jgi:hypothetical protein
MPETMGAGVAVFDYDGDGDPDVFYVDSGAMRGYQGETPRSVLLRNEGAGKFVDVTERSGIRVTSYGMGTTAGDVDGDSDLDYVSAFGPDQLFRNNGDGSNTAAIGARVELETGGRKQVREIRTGASYLSQSALTLHFGMGTAAQADRLSIRWPDGKVQVLRNLPHGRRIVVVQ